MTRMRPIITREREQEMEASGCTGKKPLTHKEAVRIARHAAEGDHLHAYRCNWCHHWHLGQSVAPKHIRRELRR